MAWSEPEICLRFPRSISRSRRAGSSDLASVQVLESSYFSSLLNESPNSACGGMSGCQRGDTRNVVTNRRAPDGLFVIKGFPSERCIDDQIDLAGFDQIHDVGAAFVDLEHRLRFNASRTQRRRGSARSGKLEVERRQFSANRNKVLFVAIVHAEKYRALARQALARGELRFGEREAVGCGDAHHLARGAHFRAEDGVYA